MNYDVSGFYTEEVRENISNSRIGFDIITFNNDRAILARKGGGRSTYKVGNYNVFVTEFEKTVLPLFNNVKSICIIDEVGKMEMFSNKFQKSVETVIKNPNVQVLVTVPLKCAIPLVQQLKNDPNSIVKTVNISNRDKMIDEILSFLTHN